MAFVPGALTLLVDGIGGGSLRIFGYLSEDDSDAVTGAGYFTLAVKAGLRLGDAIWVSSPTTGASFGVSIVSISAGNATAELIVDTDTLEQLAQKQDIVTLIDSGTATGVPGTAPPIGGLPVGWANVIALAGLVLAANKLPYATGTAALALTDFPAAGRSLVAASGAAANKLPYYTSTSAVGLADLTAAGRALIDDADADAQRTTLAVQNADILGRNYTPTGGYTRTLREGVEEARTVHHYGAIGDGTSHPLSERFASLGAAQAVYAHATALTEEIDWAAIQAMINHVGVAHLGRGKSYRVNKQITIDGDNEGIVGDGTSEILAVQSAFSNQLKATERGTTSVVIDVFGELSGDYTPVKYVQLKGFTIRGGVDYEVDANGERVISGSTDTTYDDTFRAEGDVRNLVVLLRNAADFEIEGLDISYFGVGAGIALESVTGGVVRFCRIHDWYSNADWTTISGGSQPISHSQSTGIQVDDLRPTGSVSVYTVIELNSVKHLRKGDALVSSLGQQSDGVNLQGPGDCRITIRNNYFEGVDEGVDVFSRACLIDGNVVINPTAAGVKLIHGAQRNRVVNNYIKSAQLWAITLNGSTANTHVDGNVIEGNHVDGLGAAGAFCIDIGDTSGGGNYECRNNIFRGNRLDATGGLLVYRPALNVGTNNIADGDIIVAAGSSGTLGGGAGSGTKLRIKDPVIRGFFVDLSDNFTDGSGNTIIDSARGIRLRSYTFATLPSHVAGLAVYCSDLYSGNAAGIVVSNGTRWVPHNVHATESSITSDADLTLTPMTSAPDQRHNGTLTADRAITLSTTNAYNGSRFRVVRTGGGAFNLNIAHSAGTKALTTNTWAEFVYTGSAWRLVAAGAL